MNIRSLIFIFQVYLYVYTVYLSRVILSNGVGCTSCEKSPQDTIDQKLELLDQIGKKSYTVLCEEYGIGRSTISDIKKMESVIRTNSLIWTLFNSCWYKAIRISEGLLYFFAFAFDNCIFSYHLALSWCLRLLYLNCCWQKATYTLYINGLYDTS